MSRRSQSGIVVQRGIESSLQNVCAKTFEIECQPVLVASLNTSPRPCARMWNGPFSISPVLVNNRDGAISRRAAAVIPQRAPPLGRIHYSEIPFSCKEARISRQGTTFRVRAIKALIDATQTGCWRISGDRKRSGE